MWELLIFIRSAGISQRALSKSNSDLFAAINSPVRTKVRARSLIPLYIAMRDGETEDLAGRLESSLRDIPRAAVLDRFDHVD